MTQSPFVPVLVKLIFVYTFAGRIPSASHEKQYIPRRKKKSYVGSGVHVCMCVCVCVCVRACGGGMDNKNPESDIGVQPEDQKNKAASHWLLL